MCLDVLNEKRLGVLSILYSRGMTMSWWGWSTYVTSYRGHSESPFFLTLNDNFFSFSIYSKIFGLLLGSVLSFIEKSEIFLETLSFYVLYKCL